MDDAVRLALAKWPNVPHCYGWLALDARGAFRMRDDAAQAAKLAGDVIRHPALLGFIFRNYGCDDRGAWFFQNGPQRVYVELETTPFVARTDPILGFVTHDGEVMGKISKTFMTGDGRLLLQSDDKIAMLDDRDLAECLPRVTLNALPCDDVALMSWLASSTPSGRLRLSLNDSSVDIERIASEQLEQRFGFVAHPSRLSKNV